MLLQSHPLVCAALLATLVPAAGAQMHHVEAPQRVTRAVGVYEWTGDLAKPTAARFVPVSLFINGRFEDAGLYLARPVPFALQPGYVYALEHAGQTEGLLDLNLARRIVTGKALADDNPEGAWYAYGKFTPETTPAAPHLHPSKHLSTIQSSGGPASSTDKAADADSGRPHMSRRTPAPDQTGSDKTDAEKSGSASTSPGDASGSTPQTGSGSKDSASTTTSTTTTPPGDSDDTDRPTLRRRDPGQDAARRRDYGSHSRTASVTAAGPALGDDPDRPTLGRNNVQDTDTPELTGLPTDMRQAVAVSDATQNDAHPFAREWDSPAERAETLAAMQGIAKSRIAAYLATNQLVASNAPISAAAPGQAATAPTKSASAATDAGTPPKLQRGVPQQYKNPETGSPTAPSASAAATAPASAPRSRTAARRAGTLATAHPATLSLAQEELSGFTLSYGGLPTFVYTAAASVAPAKPSGATQASIHPVAYVTVVAQRLPTGEIQAALANVTDSGHLDRGPRLRLIDAVDPDDSHRASLLFELRGGSSRQFALYRLTSAQAEQTFTTASLE